MSILKYKAIETPDGMWSAGFDSISIADKESFYFTGSFHVLKARLLGFSYPDYLKFCSKNGGTLKGRTGYAVVTFKEKKDCENICSLLNAQIKKLDFLEKYE